MRPQKRFSNSQRQKSSTPGRSKLAEEYFRLDVRRFAYDPSEPDIGESRDPVDPATDARRYEVEIKRSGDEAKLLPPGENIRSFLNVSRVAFLCQMTRIGSRLGEIVRSHEDIATSKHKAETEGGLPEIVEPDEHQEKIKYSRSFKLGPSEAFSARIGARMDEFASLVEEAQALGWSRITARRAEPKKNVDVELPCTAFNVEAIRRWIPRAAEPDEMLMPPAGVRYEQGELIVSVSGESDEKGRQDQAKFLRQRAPVKVLLVAVGEGFGLSTNSEEDGNTAPLIARAAGQWIDCNQVADWVQSAKLEGTQAVEPMLQEEKSRRKKKKSKGKGIGLHDIRLRALLISDPRPDQSPDYAPWQASFALPVHGNPLSFEWWHLNSNAIVGLDWHRTRR